MNEENLIYNADAINIKVKRLSIQILEDLIKESELHFIGIKGGGIVLAEMIAKTIQKIKPISVHIHELSINKQNPLKEEIGLSVDTKELKNKVIVLIDDVSNTGRTLFYALTPLLRITTKAVKVAVLVDRQHKKFPISSDYVGNSLSTTMKEHIDVVFSGKKAVGVYLS